MSQYAVVAHSTARLTLTQGDSPVFRYLLWRSRDATRPPPARKDGSTVVVGAGHSVKLGVRRRAADGPLLLEVLPHHLLSTQLSLGLWGRRGLRATGHVLALGRSVSLALSRLVSLAFCPRLLCVDEPPAERPPQCTTRAHFRGELAGTPR